MSERLPDAAKELLSLPVFVSLASVMPDGQPQLSVVWVTTDGDDLLFSTLVGRRKQVNFARDPRATALVSVPDNPYAYLEVRGTVTMTADGGRQLIDDLNFKYHGVRPYPNDRADAQRVVVRLTPRKVIWHA